MEERIISISREVNKEHEIERDHIADLKLALSIISDIEGRYKQLTEELALIEDELFDQTHDMENMKFDVRRGYKLAKKFHDSRERRRKLKNELAILQPLYEWHNRNKNTEIDLFKIKNQMEKVKYKQDNWVYVKRVKGNE